MFIFLIQCCLFWVFSFFSIGLSIARQLARDGAKVVVSSRKQDNVIKATNTLEKEGLEVMGVMCHVGKHQHRQNLIERVRSQLLYTCTCNNGIVCEQHHQLQ